MRILHLSDTHLTGDGSLHQGAVDTTAALRRVLARCAPLTAVDAVVVSGDLSDDGSAAAYRLLRGAVDPFAAARGAQVLYVMGNHDVRAGFERVIGARTGAVTIGGVRLVRLDSSVPERGYGHVAEADLDALRAELATPAPGGSVLVLHHPPVPARTALLQALELDNPSALADVVAGSDVRLVLAGHFHHPLATTFADIPLVVAPGVANTTDVMAAAGHERATTGSGAALIDLPPADDIRGAAAGLTSYPPPIVTFLTAPDEHDGTELFDLPPATVAEIAAKAGAPQ